MSIVAQCDISETTAPRATQAGWISVLAWFEGDDKKRSLNVCRACVREMLDRPDGPAAQALVDAITLPRDPSPSPAGTILQ